MTFANINYPPLIDSKIADNEFNKKILCTTLVLIVSVIIIFSIIILCVEN
jgi:hypothetical protein